MVIAVGKGKSVDEWILEFTKYCRLIRLEDNDHILTTFGIAMTGKVDRWWEYAERHIRPKECATKLKQLCQGNFAIANLFTEAEDLNLYAQLDPDNLPLLPKPGLNTNLPHALSVFNPLSKVRFRMESSHWNRSGVDHKEERIGERTKSPEPREISSNSGNPAIPQRLLCSR